MTKSITFASLAAMALALAGPAFAAGHGAPVDCAVNPAHADCVNRTGSGATAPGQAAAPDAATPKNPEPAGGENKPGHGGKGN